jgi:hypothetical protein
MMEADHSNYRQETKFSWRVVAEKEQRNYGFLQNCEIRL